MNRYIRNTTEENSVAIQIWRHKLMHTANPRILKNDAAHIQYYWLLHWYAHLPEEQHFTFSETTERKILNIGLVYLVRDIKAALFQYEKDIAIFQELKDNFISHSNELTNYKYKRF